MMNYNQLLLECIFTLLMAAVGGTAQKTTTYSISSYCGNTFGYMSITPDEIIFVEYSNEKLETWRSCLLDFYATSHYPDDEVKTCVTVEVFNLTDDGLRLKFGSPTNQNTYFKSSPPPDNYCTAPEENLIVSVANTGRGHGDDRGIIRLKLDSIVTYDSQKAGEIIGGAVAGGVVFVLLCLFGVTTLVNRCGGKRNPQGRQGLVISSPGSQNANQSQPQQIVLNQNPSENQYPTQQPFQVQPDVKRYTDPPPGYDEVVRPQQVPPANDDLKPYNSQSMDTRF